MEWKKNRYRISTNKQDLQTDVIHGFLKTAYWSPGIAKETVQKAMDNSLCFGLYSRERQIGFARVVTDRTKFAYLADVFVLPEYRGAGLGKWLIECILQHPDLKNINRIMLATKDAHELYRPFGFTELSGPERLMEKLVVKTANDANA